MSSRRPQRLTMLASSTLPNDFVPGWYAVASTRELVARKPLALERFGQRLVVFRNDDGIAALWDRCPHRGVALSAGYVRDNRIVCAFHGHEFDGEGVCHLIPAHGPDGHIPRKMRARPLPVVEAHGFIFLWWGVQPDELPKIDWFHDELKDCFEPHESWRDTEVGLSRNVENQLDLAHLPFVHRRTIGRFVKSALTETDTAVDGQRLRAFRKGSSDFYVEFRFPNTWINNIGNGRFIVLAFAPLNATATRLYTRFYQSHFRVPLLRNAYGWFMMQSNKVILGEDIRVIESHQPLVSPELDGSEVLIPSDAAIIAYRKMREAALQEETPPSK